MNIELDAKGYLQTQISKFNDHVHAELFTNLPSVMFRGNVIAYPCPKTSPI
jgi:hypothetical protein